MLSDIRETMDFLPLQPQTFLNYMSKHHHWLQNELKSWLSEGLINAEQAENLKNRYPADPDESSWNAGEIVLAVLGALLLGAGALLIFTFQWEHLSEFWKKVMSFLPALVGAVVYGFVIWKGKKSLAWREGASGFFAIMLASTLGLVLHTFYDASFDRTFLLIGLLCCLPLVYVLNSSLCAFLYLAGLCQWAIIESDQTLGVGSWVLLLALAPHFYKNWKNAGTQPIRSNLLCIALVIVLPFIWFSGMGTYLAEYGIFGPAIWMAILVLTDRLVFADKTFGPRQLLAFGGVIAAFILLLVVSSDMGIRAFEPVYFFGGHSGLQKSMATARIVVLAAFLLAWMYSLIRYAPQAFRHAGLSLLALLPLMTYAYMFIYRSGEEVLAMVLINVYALACGAGFIRQGLKQPSLFNLNLGMLFVLGIATARFFDTDWNLMTKGLAFLAMGALFLIINLRFRKRHVRSPG
jgi:uncharacterized membrane protein